MYNILNGHNEDPDHETAHDIRLESGLVELGEARLQRRSAEA